MECFLNKSNISYQLSNLRQIVFEVTDACNLKCKYCGYGEFYEDYDKRENKNLSIEETIAVLDYLIQFWQSNQNVSFNKNVFISFYSGEPLLKYSKKKWSLIQHGERSEIRNHAMNVFTNFFVLLPHIMNGR